MSHDPSEITLIWWFAQETCIIIISAEISSTASYFHGNHYTWNWNIKIRNIYFTNMKAFTVTFDQLNASLLNKIIYLLKNKLKSNLTDTKQSHNKQYIFSSCPFYICPTRTVINEVFPFHSVAHFAQDNAAVFFGCCILMSWLRSCVCVCVCECVFGAASVWHWVLALLVWLNASSGLTQAHTLTGISGHFGSVSHSGSYGISFSVSKCHPDNWLAD